MSELRIIHYAGPPGKSADGRNRNACVTGCSQVDAYAAACHPANTQVGEGCVADAPPSIHEPVGDTDTSTDAPDMVTVNAITAHALHPLSSMVHADPTG